MMHVLWAGALFLCACSFAVGYMLADSKNMGQKTEYVLQDKPCPPVQVVVTPERASDPREGKYFGLSTTGIFPGGR